MKRLLVALFFASLCVSGCTARGGIDSAALEADAKATYAQQLIDRGETKLTVTEVKFVPDPKTQYQFNGYVKYSDGMTITLIATIDPKTGQVLYTPKPFG